MSELTCREVIECLADYFEDVPGPFQREELDAHLAVCDDCLVYLRQYRETLLILKEGR